jgi:hypothetical protein
MNSINLPGHHFVAVYVLSAISPSFHELQSRLCFSTLNPPTQHEQKTPFLTQLISSLVANGSKNEN